MHKFVICVNYMEVGFSGIQFVTAEEEVLCFRPTKRKYLTSRQRVLNAASINATTRNHTESLKIHADPK